MAELHTASGNPNLAKEERVVVQQALAMVMAAYSTVPRAVDALCAGTYYYLAKPVEPADMDMVFATSSAFGGAGAAKKVSNATQKIQSPFDHFIGQSAQMQRVFQLVERVARKQFLSCTTTVLTLQ